MTKTLVLSVLVFALLPLATAAQDAGRADAMRSVFEEWLVNNQINGSGALAFEGTPVAEIGNATTPIELASVGKSITALCTAALWDAGDLDMSDTVADVLGRGPDVSIGALITHSGGIVEDITQSLMWLWLDTDADRGDLVLQNVPNATGPVGQYAYNNVNYALLGLVIEASAPGSYQETCRRLVLDPAGAHGQPSPRTGGFLAWGGWEMSPLDYARLHSHWYGQGTSTGRDPFAYPHVQLFEDGPFYGLGTVFRENHTGDGSFNFWHVGALCFQDRLNVGAYAVTFGGKWTAVFGYDGCMDDVAVRDLDLAIGGATYGPLP